MPITLNGSTGITSPEVTLDNTSADGGQVVLKSSGYDNWNLDNFNGRFRAYNGSTERMTIDTSGNLGIGTSSPSTFFAKLAVVGNTSITGGNNLILWNSSNSTNSYLGNPTASDSVVAAYTSSTERMRIDSSGNLLINNTSGAGGTPPNSGFVMETGGNIKFRVVSNGSAASQYYNQSGTVVGSVVVNASTTTYNTSSDYRLKENIAPMTGALATVSALKPVTYTWKVDGSSGQGFIAHELQEVVPDCVTGEKDAVDADGNPVYQGIDTSFLVATLTAAIQEQQAIIESQASAITALEARLTALEQA